MIKKIKLIISIKYFIKYYLKNDLTIILSGIQAMFHFTIDTD